MFFGSSVVLLILASLHSIFPICDTFNGQGAFGMKDNKLTQKDLKIIATENCYQGFFELKKFQIKHRLFAGGWSELIEREVLVRTHVAAAIPYDPYRDEVILIEQFRTGAMENSHPWLLEFVAGIANSKDESPEALMLREMVEEAGVQVLDLKKIYEYWVTPGSSNEYLTLFCAKIDTESAGGIHGLKNEQEDIFVHAVKTEKAFELLAEGRIKSSLTIIGIQWLQLNKAQLDAEWMR